MALWVDKYRPRSLPELDLHPEVNTILGNIAQARDLPHLLLHGPPGAGKKTRVMALLRAQFGDDVMTVRMEHKTVSVSDSRSVEISTVSSRHHIDLNPSDVGATYDRVIVMDTIREIAATVPLSMTSTLASAASGSSGPPGYKVVILNEVDKLSRAAQQALRRTMEKYVSTCRLILVCNSSSRVIAPLRSRCLSLRIPAVTNAGVEQVLRATLAKEGVADVHPAFIASLVTRADGNLRRALLMAEAAKMQRCNFAAGDGSDIPVPEWQLAVREVATESLQEQTPKRLHDVRLRLYDLLAQCIPPDTIFRMLVDLLVPQMAPSSRIAVLGYAAQFSHCMSQGSKPIMHLEAFIAHVMLLRRAEALQTTTMGTPPTVIVL